jgi:hypothetical protein
VDAQRRVRGYRHWEAGPPHPNPLLAGERGRAEFAANLDYIFDSLAMLMALA